MHPHRIELDGRDRGMPSTSRGGRRSDPIDRDQLRALRALRAVFGSDQVLVVGVDDNLHDNLPDAPDAPDVPGAPNPAHAQFRVDGGVS